MSHFLLTVRGNPNSDKLEEARVVHNQVAGSDPAIAAARALGDLSHVVYVPLSGANELLFLDIWTSPQGIQRFFGDPDVQKGGARLFRARDAVVWELAQDFAHYQLPPLRARPERFLGVLSATIKSRDAARTAFDALATAVTAARPMGQLSHEVYFRLDAELDMLAIDTWMDRAGMDRFYADASQMAALEGVFAGPPMTSTWRQAPGDWKEW